MKSSRASGASIRPYCTSRSATSGTPYSVTFSCAITAARLLGPVRLGVGPLHQVAAEPLGPLRLDRGVLAGPEPAGLDQLAGHEERRVAALQDTAGEDREPGAAGAEVLARSPAAAGGVRAVPLLQQPDVGQQPREQRLVDAVGVGRVRGLPELDPHLAADLAQLALELLPLPHPQVVEELPLAHPAERR